MGVPGVSEAFQEVSEAFQGVSRVFEGFQWCSSGFQGCSRDIMSGIFNNFQRCSSGFQSVPEVLRRFQVCFRGSREVQKGQRRSTVSSTFRIDSGYLVPWVIPEDFM